MTFSQVDFYLAVLDIQKYLGYLKGNELAFEYLESIPDAEVPVPGTEELYFPHSLQMRDWRTPCPEDRFKAAFVNYAPPFRMPLNASESEIEAVRQEIKDNLNLAWNNGPTWADGIYEYLNDVGRQFVKPDVDTMAASVNKIATDVVNELSYGLNDDWAGLEYLLHQWHGVGAGGFTEYYSNFNDVLARFGMLNGHVAAGFAMATRLINGYQQASWEFVDSVREGLKGHLAAWVEFGGKPPHMGEFPAWLPDALKIAEPIYNMIKLIPGVKAVTTPIDAAITISQSVQDLIRLLPEGEAVTKPYDFEGSTADAIYAEITDKFYNDFYAKFVDGLDEINSPTAAVNPDHADDPGFSASDVEAQMLELQGDLDQWELPEVPSGSLLGPNDTYPG